MLDTGPASQPSAPLETKEQFIFFEDSIADSVPEAAKSAQNKNALSLDNTTLDTSANTSLPDTIANDVVSSQTNGSTDRNIFSPGKAYAKDDQPKIHAGAKDFSRSHQSNFDVCSSDDNRQSIYLAGDDVLLSIRFYSVSSWRLISWYACCILSVGVLLVVGAWYPKVWLAWNTNPTKPKGDLKHKGRIIATVNVFDDSTEICKLQKRRLREPLHATTVFPPSMKIPPTSSSSSAVSLPPVTLPYLTHEKASADESLNSEMLDFVYELDYRSTKFLLHPSGKLVLLSDWRDPNWTNLATLANGVPQDKRKNLQELLGKNLIDVKGRSIPEIFFQEALHRKFVCDSFRPSVLTPLIAFNIFQVYSIILWCTDDYVPYAVVVAAITIIGMMLTVIETKRAIIRMRKMSRFVCDVKLLRHGQNDTTQDSWSLVDSTVLVPGDVIDLAAIDEGKITTLPCDCVLLDSDAIVSEAMLTGESVPVAKSGISNQDVVGLQTPSRDTKLDKHCLFGGTTLIRARSTSERSSAHAKAVVIRTGFNTAKGNLIRQMLFPRRIKFRFYRDAFKAIGVLFFLACLGLISSVVYFVHIGVDPAEIAVRSLDVLTISVPPALPAALSIATTFALARLRRQQIFCTSPQRINVAGMVTAIVFDKTGTLTEEGLSVLGVSQAGTTSQSPAKTFSELPIASSNGRMLRSALSTTHDLYSHNGNILGEPLEASMFKWTGATLEEKEVPLRLYSDQSLNEARSLEGKPTYVKIVKQHTNIGDKDELAIVRKFDFVAALRRMSVMVKKVEDSATYIFVKGAAESIASLCKNSSFPADYDRELDRWTHGGFRVLALAGKRIDRLDWSTARSMSRADVESDLYFLGLLIFENKLKDGAKETLSLLRQGSIISKMCTGDAPLTAISVAKECGLIALDQPTYMARVSASIDEQVESKGTVEWVDIDNQQNSLENDSMIPQMRNIRLQDVGLCVSGETYAYITSHSSQEIIDKMLVQCQVFARFSPEQKQDLVERLQGIDYTVAMVGDGANDMGALKSADVGLSLSQAEASVAAPFTSEKLRAIEELCREGRNAVTSTVSLFNFFILYGLTEYLTVLYLYGAPFFSTTMNNAEYLYIDIFLVFPFAIGVSASRPSLRLAKQAVRTRIVCRRNIISLFGQIIFMILTLTTIYVVLHQQPFYQPPEYDPEDIVTQSQDNTAIFRASIFTYPTAIIIWNLGPPHRRILPFNYLLLSAIVILTIFNFYLLFSTGGGLFELFEFENSVSLKFSWITFGIIIAQFIFGSLFEVFGTDVLAEVLKQPLYMIRRWFKVRVRNHDHVPETKYWRQVTKVIEAQ